MISTAAGVCLALSSVLAGPHDGPSVGPSAGSELAAELAAELALEVTGAAPSVERVGDDAIGLDVSFEVSGSPGDRILVTGTLSSLAGTPITAQQAYFRSALASETVEIGGDGVGRGVYRFSGEGIRMAMVDGPWNVSFWAMSQDDRAGAVQVEWQTPAMRATDFGEQVARPVHTAASAPDGTVTVRIVVDVSEAFEAFASVFVGPMDYEEQGGLTLHAEETLEPGVREFVLTATRDELAEAGLGEPPYRVIAGVSDQATLTSLQPRRSTVPLEQIAEVPEWELRRGAKATP